MLLKIAIYVFTRGVGVGGSGGTLYATNTSVDLNIR